MEARRRDPARGRVVWVHATEPGVVDVPLVGLEEVGHGAGRLGLGHGSEARRRN